MESCIVSKIVQSSFPRLDFVPRDYEFEKSENDSEFARLEYNVPLTRAIFFITLFVMNYKVASLEIIRGSRDPVFFLISLVRLISSKREEMFIVSVKRIEIIPCRQCRIFFFTYLNVTVDEKFLNFYLFRIIVLTILSVDIRILMIEVNIIEVNIL